MSSLPEPPLDLKLIFRVNNAINQFAQKYLQKVGWYNSLDGVPRNADGYVPWITYPAYKQLTRLVKPEHKVFEFGCGASSLWWANKVSEIVGVDHDPVWIEKIKAEKPANATFVVKEQGAACAPEHAQILQSFFDLAFDFPLSNKLDFDRVHGLLNHEFSAYVAEILKYPKGYFDIICIDGMARALCAWIAADYIKPSGFIVFDNADRWIYNPVFHLLSQKGFRRIDFYGPGPSRVVEWDTSFFVKDLDVFADNIDSPLGESDLD